MSRACASDRLGGEDGLTHVDVELVGMDRGSFTHRLRRVTLRFGRSWTFLFSPRPSLCAPSFGVTGNTGISEISVGW